MLRYASKNRLPEGLKEQMLAHMQLKFKTAELQQEEVLEDLPKAIRSSIAQHLFHKTIENTYLFRDVSDDLISQLVKYTSILLKTWSVLSIDIFNNYSKINRCQVSCSERISYGVFQIFKIY